MSLLIGLHMEQVIEFFKQLNIAICSRATLYRLQSVVVNPTIWTYWREMAEDLRNKLKSCGRSIVVSGDGQE
jgi:hypothetical protein